MASVSARRNVRWSGRRSPMPLPAMPSAKVRRISSGPACLPLRLAGIVFHRIFLSVKALRIGQAPSPALTLLLFVLPSNHL